MKREMSMALGIVIEKRKVDHPWLDWSWRPVAILPGADPIDEWVEVDTGENWVRYHAATVPLTLYFSDTEAYLFNLADRVPSVYVILREEEEESSKWPVRVHLATVSPFESQQFEDSGEDIIERVPLPGEMIGWLEAFIAFHHEDDEFVKRKRKGVKTDDRNFGKEPIFGQATVSQIKGRKNDH